MDIQKLKLEFYNETDELIGGTFKEHVRDAVWQFIESKISIPMQAVVKPEIASRYFLDTEFIEYPNTIDLISIGIVCEDGRKYYAISSEFDEAKANDWVLKNVIYKLESLPRKSIGQIKQELLEFITGDNIEFWGYYSDYDWVVFCWIFGTMMELPNGYPIYCKDLKQLLDESGKDKIPEPVGEHNALADAEWNLKLYKHLQQKQFSV